MPTAQTHTAAVTNLTNLSVTNLLLNLQQALLAPYPIPLVRKRECLQGVLTDTQSLLSAGKESGTPQLVVCKLKEISDGEN